MDFITRKYLEFYENYGYIPEMFNPYNRSEIRDICPALTAHCGNAASSAAVLIMVEGANNDFI